MVTLDERVGAAAVYDGPQVNCFSELRHRRVYVRVAGRYLPGGGGWKVPHWKLLLVRVVGRLLQRLLDREAVPHG